jgi:uncharacterized protein YciI
MNRVALVCTIVLIASITDANPIATRAQSGTPAAAGQPANLFALVMTTGPEWKADKAPNEQAFFREHSQNLAMLRREGKIEAGGRFGPYGLIVLKAATEADARAMVDADPSVKAGVFKAELYPWTTIFAGTFPERR